jgi:hypothetical protein
VENVVADRPLHPSLQSPERLDVATVGRYDLLVAIHDQHGIRERIDQSRENRADLVEVQP